MSINNRLRSSRNSSAAAGTGGGAAASLESRFNETSHRALNKINNTIENLKTNTLPRAEHKIKEKIDDMTPVLTNAQLRNLDNHKYSASGNTLLDPIFQVYWRWLVEKVPLWVAPNLLTVVGLALNVFTSTILMIYSPNCDSENVPWWSLILCGLGLFAYQSLDAIDGKQARRTNSSSPLGELFDHGCDAVSTVFVAIACCVALGLGQYPWLMFLVAFLGMVTFYTAHWQTYVTGTLKFGTIDVTEAQLSIYSIYFLSGLFGVSFWSYQLPIVNIELRFGPAIFAIVASFISIFKNIAVISKGGKGKRGSTVADTSIVFPVFPLFLFLFLAFSIAQKSSIIFLQNQCLYVLTFGFVWAKVTIKLIIAHMTKGEIYLFDTCLTGPVLLLLNQYFSYLVPELLVLHLCLIIALIDLMKYCVKVCYQICTHMNIFLFKITPPVTEIKSSH